MSAPRFQKPAQRLRHTLFSNLQARFPKAANVTTIPLLSLLPPLFCLHTQASMQSDHWWLHRIDPGPTQASVLEAREQTIHGFQQPAFHIPDGGAIPISCSLAVRILFCW